MIGALLDPALEPIVDMVVNRAGSGYEARAPGGHGRLVERAGCLWRALP